MNTNIMRPKADTPFTIDYGYIFEEVDSTVEFHDYLDLYAVQKGKLLVSVNNSTYLLQACDILLTNTQEIHRVFPSNNAQCIHLKIPYQCIKSITEHFILYSYELNSSEHPQQKKTDAFNNIWTMLYHMIDLLELEPENFKAKLHIIFFQLLLNLNENFKIKKQSLMNKDSQLIQIVDKIVKYIDKNYNKSMTMKDIAYEVGLEYHYFSRFFKQNFGVTFQFYLNSIRLKHAICDLMNMEKSVDNIAINHGFPSPNSFYRAFKQRYHCTPLQYRKQLLNNN